MNAAQDVVAYLLASTGGGAQDGEHHAVRQAVMQGVREVMQCRQWLWHTRTGSFTTTQIATTGTVTLGSKQVTVVSADGFVPGRCVEISAAYFPTPARIVAVTGNVVTLDTTALQTAAGVTLTPQTFYDLPVDLKDIDSLVTNTVGTLHCYITPQEWQRLDVPIRGSGEPYYYTVMRSDLYPDRYQVRFVGVSYGTTVVHYTYRIIPPTIKYMGYERICRQGTVGVTLLGATNTPMVTGVKTAFPQDCAGSYIRFGSEGMEADPVGSSAPFIMERRIEKWNCKTELLVSSTTVYNRPGPYGPADPDQYDGGVVGQTAAAAPVYAQDTAVLPVNSKYAITDVLDASPQMYTAIISACEMWYARIAGKPSDAAMTLFGRDLRLAMENDVITPRSGRPMGGAYASPRSMGWHSNLLSDVE